MTIEFKLLLLKLPFNFLGHFSHEKLLSNMLNIFFDNLIHLKIPLCLQVLTIRISEIYFTTQKLLMIIKRLLDSFSFSFKLLPFFKDIGSQGYLLALGNFEKLIAIFALNSGFDLILFDSLIRILPKPLNSYDRVAKEPHIFKVSELKL